jgi:uncharacterized protein (TIGR00369 family)
MTTQPYDIEQLLSYVAAQPEQLHERMGLRLTTVEPGRVVGTLPVAGNRQPYGLLHGGASCVLVETLGSIAAGVHAGRDKVAVGVDINVTHHRGARDGVITGVCRPLHEGGQIATYEVHVTDEADRPVATGRLTCALLPRRPGS